ncbi:MAG: tetratricopeptide repeat protein [Deltaproteobacteria bacterium]|nr:tetratricopeptide repeat protein [Deltaproteobacteria bacterium]
MRPDIEKLSLMPLLVFFLFLSASCAHVGREPELMTREERLSLAAIYESKGETELALREYSRAAEEGGSADAYFAIANIRLKAGDLKEAERNYLKAVRINPANAAYRNNLGWLYMEKGELKKAERSAREALRLDPGKGFVYLDTLGVIQTRFGSFKEAEASLMEASRLAPAGDRQGRIEIYSHLGDLYRKTGEIDKAVRMEERIKALR